MPAAASAAAEALARLPEADDQPLRVWAILALLIIAGWGAGSLHTLARIMDDAVSKEDKLRVWQGLLASIAAGTLAFLGILQWTDWGRMAAYFVAFLFAYAGTLALDAGRDAVISALTALFQGIANRGARKP